MTAPGSPDGPARDGGTIYSNANERARSVIGRIALTVCLAVAALMAVFLGFSIADGYFGWDFYFLVLMLAASFPAALLIRGGKVTAGGTLLVLAIETVIGIEPWFVLGSPIDLAGYVAVNGIGFVVGTLLAGLFVRRAVLVVVTLAGAADLVAVGLASGNRQILGFVPFVVIGLLVSGGLTFLFSSLFRGALAAAREEERKAAAFREQLLHSQKIEALGRFAGSIAHDFNNILMAVGGQADFALARPSTDPGVHTSLQEIRQYAGKAAALVNRLLVFSRKAPVASAVFDLRSTVAGMKGMLDVLLGARIVLTIALGEIPLSVRGERGQMEQVVMNLAVNARDAMPDGGQIDIALGRTGGAPVGPVTTPPLKDRPYAVLSVRDKGVGMSPRVMERLFEPFFTTKPEGVGMGLGLSTTYAIVSGAGGGIAVESSPGAGSTFTVYLPCE